MMLSFRYLASALPCTVELQ